VLGAGDWRARLNEFDWVILAAALTGQTRHPIGGAELNVMKSSAWVFNPTRGAVVDQDAA
jgi:phosphoglycerate dehydrogenase-like enzyme